MASQTAAIATLPAAIAAFSALLLHVESSAGISWEVSTE